LNGQEGKKADIGSATGMVGAAGTSWPVFVGSFPIGSGVGCALNRGDVGGEDVEGNGTVGTGGDVGDVSDGSADCDVGNGGDNSSVGKFGGNCARYDWKSLGEGTFFGGVDGVSGERDGE
jgi:hypothetical protein